jgi:hypothetical protein
MKLVPEALPGTFAVIPTAPGNGCRKFVCSESAPDDMGIGSQALFMPVKVLDMERNTSERMPCKM